MKRRVGRLTAAVALGILVAVVRAAEKTPSQYELYSWKTGNDWTYALLPASSMRRVDAEIVWQEPVVGLERSAELLKVRIDLLIESATPQFIHKPPS